MPDMGKVIKEYEEFVDKYECFSSSDDYVLEMHKAVLALLKDQEADIKNLNETIANLLQRITEMKMIYGDCEYVGELVRCKDCDNKECCGRAGDVVCGIDGTPHRPDWFCADGERK